jgi:hypothetical protein
MQPAMGWLGWAKEVIGLQPLVVTHVGDLLSHPAACLRLREVW